MYHHHTLETLFPRKTTFYCYLWIKGVCIMRVSSLAFLFILSSKVMEIENKKKSNIYNILRLVHYKVQKF